MVAPRAAEPTRPRRRVPPWWSPALRRLAVGAGTALLLVVIFVLLGDAVAEDGRVSLDRSVSLAVHRQASPGRTTLMRLMTDLGAAPVTIPLILLALGWLLWRGRHRAAVLVAVGWLGAQALDAVLKPLYHRDRPELFPHLAGASSFSFPSGHTTTAVMTYGLLAYLVGHQLRGWARALPALVAAVAVAGVALSRVYLGVHYFSDVLGSVLIGGAWLRGTLLALERLDRPRPIGTHRPDRAGGTPRRRR